eukprot:1328625-Amorphochlora_amoeboformis.AAC.1
MDERDRQEVDTLKQSERSERISDSLKTKRYHRASDNARACYVCSPHRFSALSISPFRPSDILPVGLLLNMKRTRGWQVGLESSPGFLGCRPRRSLELRALGRSELKIRDKCSWQYPRALWDWFRFGLMREVWVVRV